MQHRDWQKLVLSVTFKSCIRTATRQRNVVFFAEGVPQTSNTMLDIEMNKETRKGKPKRTASRRYTKRLKNESVLTSNWGNRPTGKIFYFLSLRTFCHCFYSQIFTVAVVIIHYMLICILALTWFHYPLRLVNLNLNKINRIFYVWFVNVKDSFLLRQRKPTEWFTLYRADRTKWRR